ncbi:MAG: hypothetical protein JSW71_23295 [Gemmatimonadota bacterium]|nr:MAG: hypothetical protein JSW71_23295 [Gemmatimonadota bacterium]
MDAKHISAIIPLAVLQAVRAIDQRGQERSAEYQEEFTLKRLGMSPTVTAQIERYRQLALRKDEVELEEVEQLFRLVGRRSDAGLAFSQGGRLAARHALQRIPGAVKLAHKVAPFRARQRIGLRSATRLAASVFGAAMSLHPEQGVVVEAHPTTTVVTPGGVGCSFYSAALAEMLRTVMDFEGAMLHDVCVTRGDDCCRWHTGSKQGW